MYAMNHPRRVADYRLEQMDNELLLFHPAQSKVLYCNETASLIWQLCDGRHNTQEIIKLLADSYPESASEIANDVEATLKQFHAHGAIEYV